MSTGRFFKREEVIGRLRATISEGNPILASGAGCGLTAKCLEAGGIDLIFAFPMCIARLKGYASPTILEPERHNEVVLEMGKELAFMARNTPIIAPLEPNGEDHMDLVKAYTDIGFSGVMNFPSAGIDIFMPKSDHGPAENTANTRQNKERSELDTELRAIAADSEEGIFERARQRVSRGGWLQEMEMLRTCRSNDVFTASYVHSAEEARLVAENGVDCIAAWIGGTSGGMTGAEGSKSHEEASRGLQVMFDAACAVNPNIILLGHGGPFSGPDDTRYMYDHTDAVGFIAGSSMERIPIEKAIVSSVVDFKGKALRPERQRAMLSRLA